MLPTLRCERCEHDWPPTEVQVFEQVTRQSVVLCGHCLDLILRAWYGDVEAHASIERAISTGG
jgi:NAD-dependent SIR2 family protein deacetylase